MPQITIKGEDIGFGAVVGIGYLTGHYVAKANGSPLWVCLLVATTILSGVSINYFFPNDKKRHNAILRAKDVKFNL